MAYPTTAELEAEFLYRDPIVSIFAEDDPYAAMDVFPISMLTNMSYIALNEGEEDEITAILNHNQIQMNAQFMESDDHAVVAMVEQGLGTSLMSMMMIKGFDRRIAAIPLDPPGYRDLGIAVRSRGLLSSAGAAFYNYACDWIRCEYDG